MAKSSENARKSHQNDDLSHVPYSDDEVVNDKVCCALNCLTAIKKLILECRYGLNGSNGMSYEAIASLLSKKLSPETKLAITTSNTSSKDVVISADDIQTLESQALRELSRAKKN